MKTPGIKAFALIMAIALSVLAIPYKAEAATTFRLSSNSIRISKDKNITLTSSKKKDRITMTVKKPDIASVVQKSQKGKKTVFTVSPKMKGSTTVIFRSGKRTARLKVTVTKTSIETIRNGFSAQMFIADQTGTNTSVRLMVHNHTGLKAYFSDWAYIHGDLDYDGHWFNENADYSSQFVKQYASIDGNEDRQVEYYNSPAYALRQDNSYNIMTFRKQASMTVTVYFDEPTPDNAYTLTVDTNGNTTLVKA